MMLPAALCFSAAFLGLDSQGFFFSPAFLSSPALTHLSPFLRSGLFNGRPRRQPLLPSVSGVPFFPRLRKHEAAKTNKEVLSIVFFICFTSFHADYG
jgi:hypothetical protein